MRKAESGPVQERAEWREWLNSVIFDTGTRGGRIFGIVLIVSIVLSVGALMLEGIPSVSKHYSTQLQAVEWFFTILFTIEYGLRLLSAHQPRRYVFSFFGLVDLLAILPVWLSLLVPAGHYLLVVRLLRLLRVFRIFDMAHYLDEADFLVTAIRASRRKIIVFIFTVVTLVLIIGSTMYVLEGETRGFENIWSGVYWAIGTLTTVDSGNLTPQTTLGRMLASVVMILGYGILAVPTGIVTVEMTTAMKRARGPVCPSCGTRGHDDDAGYCKYCGERL